MATTLPEYYPFATGTGASVSEAQWSKLVRRLAGSGVIADAWRVGERGAGANMSVDVAAGTGLIRGHIGISTATINLAVTAADGSNARNDRVVARVDWSNDRIEFDVLAGTPAASPGTPTLTQSATVWEIGLAVVNVPAEDTTIGAAQITDTRPHAWPVRTRRALGFTIPGSFGTATVVNGIHYPVPNGVSAVLAGAVHECESGSATFSVTQNTGTVTGLGTLVITTAPGTATLGTATVAITNGDYITLKVSSESSPVDGHVTVWVDETAEG